MICNKDIRKLRYENKFKELKREFNKKWNWISKEDYEHIDSLITKYLVKREEDSFFIEPVLQYDFAIDYCNLMGYYCYLSEISDVLVVRTFQTNFIDENNCDGDFLLTY